MASQNKKKKLKNSFGAPGVLKSKNSKLKRLLFFTSAQRKENNRCIFLEFML